MQRALHSSCSTSPFTVCVTLAIRRLRLPQHVITPTRQCSETSPISIKAQIHGETVSRPNRCQSISEVCYISHTDEFLLYHTLGRNVVITENITSHCFTLQFLKSYHLSKYHQKPHDPWHLLVHQLLRISYERDTQRRQSVTIAVR